MTLPEPGPLPEPEPLPELEPLPEPGPLPEREPLPLSAPSVPTAAQFAERAGRADRATRSALAGVLGLEAVVVLLVPRAIAYTNSGLGVVRTVVLLSLAVLMLLATAVMRRSWGIGVGSALQVAFILTGTLLTAMFVVGLVFAAIWLSLLNLRHQLVGTPAGLRLLVS